MKTRVIVTSICVMLSVAFLVYLMLDAILGFGYKINIVDGKPAGLIQYHDEEYYRNKAIRDKAIVIRDGDSKSVYKLSDLGVDVEVSGYNSSKYTVSLEDMTYDIKVGDMIPTLRKDLEERLSKRTEGTVGHFDVVDNEVVIVDAEEGNMFDIDSILSYIVLRINHEDLVSVDVDDYLIEQDTDITERQNELNAIMGSYDNFSIEYTDGFVIDKNILNKYGLLKVSDDSIEVVPDEDKIIKMLVSNLVKYNSVGIDRVFKTHDEKTITITGGTYGDYIDYSTEAMEIIPMLEALESDTDRVPIMKQESKFSLDSTYIEVDKTKQHVYYYEDGELVLDTDVVTGKPTPDRQTPSGVYFILNKTKDANLIGATWNVKSERWMGVTYQGVGFHDASWRSSFGGEIYKSNGSHGCINTPKEAMFKLYDMVEEGTPVVIY